MHRRVAQTVAAVLPQTYGWGTQRDTARVIDDRLFEAHPTEIFSQRAEANSDVDIAAPYDPSTGTAQWRRMDSHGESILSGLSDDEHDHRIRRSPESMRRRVSFSSVAEEDNAEETTAFDPPYDAADNDDELEWELEQNGLYLGSYARLLALYTFVPLSAFFTFVIVALLPELIWPTTSSPSHYPTILPSPIPELILCSAMFSLAHLLRVPFYSVSSYLLRPDIACLLSTFLGVLVVNFLRLMSLVILEVRHNMDYPTPTWQDPSFHTVWWLSLNVAEVLAALAQDFQNISLYRDVIVPQGREREFLERLKQTPTDPALQANGHTYDWRESTEVSPQEPTYDLHDVENQPHGNATALNSQVDNNFDILMAVKTREELEEVYGVAVIKIPVFITCLQRFNSVILSLGLNLLLSAAFLQSALSIPASDIRVVPIDAFSHSPFLVTFPIVLVIHMSLASLYTPTILPRIGVHTAAYVGVLVSLMCFFAGLAVWGALS
ncbi:hypothetical protein V8B97DRAFT_408045 [Scleroderma yunnanense]